MKNRVVVPHNVAIRGNGVRKFGKIVLRGGTSTVTATLKRGRYTPSSAPSPATRRQG